MSSEGSSGRKSSPSRIIRQTKSSSSRSLSYSFIQEQSAGVRSWRRYSRSMPTWRISHSL